MCLSPINFAYEVKLPIADTHKVVLRLVLVFLQLDVVYCI